MPRTQSGRPDCLHDDLPDKLFATVIHVTEPIATLPDDERVTECR